MSDLDGPCPKKGEKRAVAKQSWTTAERRAVLDHFSENVKKNELPRKEECLNFLEQHKTVVRNRTWSQVKDYIRNYIVKMGKKLIG